MYMIETFPILVKEYICLHVQVQESMNGCCIKKKKKN